MADAHCFLSKFLHIIQEVLKWTEILSLKKKNHVNLDLHKWLKFSVTHGLYEPSTPRLSC